MSAHPGSGKVVWVINESRAYNLDPGREGGFDGSAIHVDCDPIEAIGT